MSTAQDPPLNNGRVETSPEPESEPEQVLVKPFDPRLAGNLRAGLG